MNDLEEGTRVDVVHFESGSKIIVDPTGGISEMVVSMQEGPGGMVPWIKVYMHSGKIKLINCEKLAVVELAVPTTPHPSMAASGASGDSRVDPA